MTEMSNRRPFITRQYRSSAKTDNPARPAWLPHPLSIRMQRFDDRVARVPGRLCAKPSGPRWALTHARRLTWLPFDGSFPHTGGRHRRIPACHRAARSRLHTPRRFRHTPRKGACGGECRSASNPPSLGKPPRMLKSDESAWARRARRQLQDNGSWQRRGRLRSS